jgi:hypothetical protein
MIPLHDAFQDPRCGNGYKGARSCPRRRTEPETQLIATTARHIHHEGECADYSLIELPAPSTGEFSPPEPIT